MITLENTKTLYDLVQNAAMEYGDKAFLRYEKDDFIYEKSYAEFSLECDALSTWIDKKNEKEGHNMHVALLGRTSYLYLTVLMGSVSAGAVAIPLDVQLSKEEIRNCLNHLDVDILFYDWEFNSQINYIRKECSNIKEFICIGNRQNVLSVQNILDKYLDNIFISYAKPEDCAIISFLSGTTGKGKGIILSHGNLINNTFCATEKNCEYNDVCLNVLPINDIYCLYGDILISMRYGMTICLNRNLSKLVSNIKLFQPTVIRLNFMIAKLLYNKISEKLHEDKVKSLKEVKEKVLGEKLHKIIVGGGYLTKALASKFVNMNILVGQEYGMSQCLIKISVPDFYRIDKISSVGKIVDECDIRIVNGEIQVKSNSVMMGYYKENDNTAEAITEDGYLKTGDIGYIDDENYLYLTGSKKNLIVLSSGENVSPEFIENQFESDELISDILVYGLGDIIAAEVYPDYEYAEVKGINDIEGEVQKIVNDHNKNISPYKRITRCKIRKKPFEKTSSNEIIRHNYFDYEKAEKEIATTFHK